MNTKTHSLIVGSFLLVSLTMIWLLGSGDETHSQNLLESAKSVNAKLYDYPLEGTEAKDNLPRSIQDIEPNFEYKLDDQQHLVASFSIREMFDYYLSTLGETDLEGVIGLIQSEINGALTEPARSEALSLLNRYVDYKIALAENQSLVTSRQDTELPMIDRLIDAHNHLKMLREQYFSTIEYDSFFSLEDAQNNFMIEQLRISNDNSLTETQKKTRLEEVSRVLLPQEVIESRERVQAHANLREKVELMRAEGSSEETIFQERADTFGVEAATALYKLDQERAKWDNRLSEFSKERLRILESGMSDDDKEGAIEMLLASHFDAKEHKRVSAIMNDGRLD